jgi:hypothetical protein
MAQTYVLRVYSSNRAGDANADHLLVTRNFKQEAKALDMWSRVGAVYEQKCNRGDDASYRLTLELRTGKGLKSSKLIDDIKERRIFPTHRT